MTLYKGILLALFFIINYSSLFSQTQPPLKYVVEVFFERYHMNSDVRFERRPDGYYIGMWKYGQSITQREKFYDSETKRYLPLKNYPTYNKDTVFYNETTWQIVTPTAEPKKRSKEYFQKISQYDLDAFERQPFYGYSRWYIDVITFYESQDELSEDELNALARAYYRAGAGLLSKSSSQYIDTDMFDLEIGQNALNSEQLKRYLYYHNKCLATYKQLAERNADYVTPVGPVSTKYAHEVMDGFLTLLYYQNEKAARELLKEDIYDERLLMYGKDILESCPQNAVLFTYGDSDTYPLYYLQAVEGFRTDVILVNLSLAVLPRYRSMLLKGPLGALPLSSELPDFYYEDQFILWMNNKSTDDKTERMTDFYTLLKDKNNYYNSESPMYTGTPGGGFIIDVPSEVTYYKEPKPKTMLWAMPSPASFIFPADIFALDMIHSNQWKRTLCFSLTTYYSSLKPWADHLVLEGLVYRVYPDSLETMNSFTFDKGAVNIDFNLGFWSNKMNIDTTSIVKGIDRTPFYQNIFMAGFRIVNKLYEKGDRQNASLFIEQLMDYFPNKIRPWDSSWLLLANLLSKEDELKYATTIMETIISNYENGLLDISDSSRFHNTITQIQVFAQENQLEELSLRCQALM